MDNVKLQMVFSAVRTLLIVLGTTMVNKGWLSTDALNDGVGALMVLIPLAWSVWEKKTSEAATKTREVTAVNVGIAVADATAGKTPPVTAEEAPQVLKTFSQEVKP